MQFNVVLNQILVLFLIILTGYLMNKKQMINNSVSKSLSAILMDITLPALIISSMTIELKPEIISNTKEIALISIIIYTSLIIVVTIFINKLPLPTKRKQVSKFLLIFSNVGYMGYPILKAIYPEYGIFYAVIANIPFNILMYTYGIYIFIKDQKKGKIKLKNLLNNGIYALIIGFILFFSQYKLPIPIQGALTTLGDMTIPLSMIIIGNSLTNVKFKEIFKDKFLYLLCFLRLIFLPLVGLLILRQFNLPEIICNISILLLAMPSAANGVIFAEMYNSDHKFASEGIFLTTLFSLITIPFFVWLINL